MKLKLLEGNPDATRSANHKERMLQENCQHPKIRLDENVGVYCPTCNVHFVMEFDQTTGEMTFWIGEPNDDVHDPA